MNTGRRRSTARAVTIRLLCALAAAFCVQATAQDAAPFAKVGDTLITQQEFDAAFAQAAHAKFYHGKPPEGEVAALQREVGQSLVDDVLLWKEAQRRQLQPDAASVQQAIDGYEQRYQASEQWKANRARVLPGLKAKLERDSVLERLAQAVKSAGEPGAQDLALYWQTHQDKFTSPEQVHLAMILLKVDPSSPQPKWDAARDEGTSIVKRLRAGAGFSELAHLHSGDGSAERGGDLGYVHRGMLPEPAQKAVDKLQPGEISDAVVLLEGVAVFRLEARKTPKLNPLDDVRERARDLWKRDRADAAWTVFLERLRRETQVELDDSRFLPLATASSPANTDTPQ
jgi:parvulin-like peptidyl-prolyl isomerase